jgi:hypothetical protein
MHWLANGIVFYVSRPEEISDPFPYGWAASKSQIFLIKSLQTEDAVCFQILVKTGLAYRSTQKIVNFEFLYKLRVLLDVFSLDNVNFV